MTEDYIEYLDNKYQKQLLGLKVGIHNKLKQDLKLEIEGLSAVADRATAEIAKDIRLYIENINQILKGDK